MKPFLVVNPRSANGATARHFDSIVQAARGALGDCPHAFTEGAMHAADLTRDALRQGHDLVIAVGGDGTINEVVNGFFEPARPGVPPRPIKPGAALAVLPRGTGGDLRRTIGLDADREGHRFIGEDPPELFALWRSHQHSFYMGDGPRPILLPSSGHAAALPIPPRQHAAGDN